MSITSNSIVVKPKSDGKSWQSVKIRYEHESGQEDTRSGIQVQ